MTLTERMRKYIWNLTEETPFCINCTHFYRHYLQSGKALDCGHCVFPRVKDRKAYDTCEHFQNKYSESDDNKKILDMNQLNGQEPHGGGEKQQ